jgi:hypothetical protein
MQLSASLRRARQPSRPTALECERSQHGDRYQTNYVEAEGLKNAITVVNHFVNDQMYGWVKVVGDDDDED